MALWQMRAAGCLAIPRRITAPSWSTARVFISWVMIITSKPTTPCTTISATSSTEASTSSSKTKPQTLLVAALALMLARTAKRLSFPTPPAPIPGQTSLSDDQLVHTGVFAGSSSLRWGVRVRQDLPLCYGIGRSAVGQLCEVFGMDAGEPATPDPVGHDR